MSDDKHSLTTAWIVLGIVFALGFACGTYSSLRRWANAHARYVEAEAVYTEAKTEMLRKE